MVSPKIQEMLELAAGDIDRLRKAKTSRSARRAWVAFLEHSNRAINRLEGYSKKTNQYDKYKNLVSKEIWSSPLTKYMRAARNASEHGVEDIEIDDPYNERIILPDGQMIGSPIVIVQNKNGEEVYSTSAGPAEFYGHPDVRRITLKPTIQLIPIQARPGDWAEPPHVPGLEAEDEPAAAAVARVYLEWVTAKVATFG